MPTAEERITELRLKTHRARGHLNELLAYTAELNKREPLEYESRFNEAEQKMEKVIVRVPGVHPYYSLIVGDAVHNARAALDHLAHHLVLANGGTPSFATKFPITKKKTDFPNVRDNFLNGVSQAALDRVDGWMPYRDAGTVTACVLWLLHELDIIDKHRVIFAAAGTIIGVDPLGAGVPEQFIRNVTPKIPFEVGDVLDDGFEAPGQAKPIAHVAGIVIAEPTIRVLAEPFTPMSFALNEPIPELIRIMIELVDSMIESFRPDLG